MQWEDRLSAEARAAQPSDIRELLKLTARPGMISFAGGLPDPALFPIEEFAAASARVTAEHGRAALQYSATEGVGELRELLVEQLAREGIACPDGVDNVLITTGSQQALELLARALVDPGDPVLVEAPSYLGALQALDGRSPRYEPIAMDAQGLRVDLVAERLADLRAESARPKLLYTVPTFQNPAGLTLAAERRRALIALAEREELLIVEDDPYGRLRFRGQAPPSLKSLDRGGRVVALRSFSKTLAPGLRTGYVVGPAPLLRRLTLLKQAADLCSPAWTQYVVLELLADGAMERYVARVIEAYRRKQELMSAALRRHLGAAAEWHDPDGGMFLWLRLTDGRDTAALLERALAVGVAYVRGAAFYRRGGGDDCLRLNFSQPSEEQIEEGARRLAALIVTAPAPLTPSERVRSE